MFVRNLRVISIMLLAFLLVSACTPATAATQAPAGQPTDAIPTQALEVLPTDANPTQPADEGGAVIEEDPAMVEGTVSIAGSSTVYPLTEAIVNRIENEGFGGDVTVASVGSGAGFERFCKAGETDIAAASRAIKEEEVANCQSIGRTPIEFRVGTDAIAVVVSSENDFLTGVTLAELAAIFSTDTVLWSDVNPEWPAEEIQRFSPGTDSGTFDYFVEAVMLEAYGEEEAAKNAILNAENIQFSEDDNVLVQGVEGSPYAIGYFGFAYYIENQGALKALPVDEIAPSAETAENGDYVLARPLFLYSDPGVLKSKPQVATFINFYLTVVNDEIETVGYFPASDESLETSRQALMEAMQ